MKLKEGTPLHMLRQFAVNLNADLNENFGASLLELDNINGKGSIALYEVFPGLTAWVYDIKFNEEYNFVHVFSKERVFYFGYHVSGHQMTKFPGEQDFKKISKGQNFILSGEEGNKSEFSIPADLSYRCCYLILQPELLKQRSTKTKKELQVHLTEIFSTTGAGKLYRYFGDIDFRTGLYSEVVIRNKRTDLVGRLLTEAAILNMLASQIEAHDHDQSTENLQPDLSKKELFRIAGLGNYIQKNIGERPSIQKLSHQIGMSPKKLQSGIRFLFGHSVNQYTSNIRLEMARELFNDSDMNVSQICYHVGYTSRSYFAKQFKKRYGVLPNDYRKSLYRDDMLYEVSYRSMAVNDISGEDIADILRISRTDNKANGITGSLIYHRTVFFQLIEGPKKAVQEIYGKIISDSRHFDVQTIWSGSKLERDFKEWDMAMLSDEGVLEVPHEGSTKTLSLGHLMGDIGEQSFESKNLWQKVRNILKTSIDGSNISDSA